LTASERGAERARKLQRIGLADKGDDAGAKIAQAQAQLGYALAQRETAVAFIAVYKSFGGTLPPLETR